MMTPPTVAPGSVVVMRRHGTSRDATPSSFYVPSHLQQESSMVSQCNSPLHNGYIGPLVNVNFIEAAGTNQRYSVLPLERHN
jgi:hypothetical protein